MNRTERCEVGPAIELGCGQTVDGRDAAILEDEEVATPQSGHANRRIALGGEITVRRKAEGSAFG